MNSERKSDRNRNSVRSVETKGERIIAGKSENISEKIVKGMLKRKVKGIV
jgi:translation elongation factor EF-Ts